MAGGMAYAVLPRGLLVLHRQGLLQDHAHVCVQTSS